MNKIRQILRQETSVAHASLDDALVKYDLKTQDGLRSYLSVHHAARQQLHSFFAGDKARRDNLDKLSELQVDLQTLGTIPPAIEMKPYDGIHPLGLTYVIAGSSLGSKLLYQDWMKSGDQVVRRAGKFLTSSKESGDWVAFLEKTRDLQLTHKEIDVAVASANIVFSIFEAANDRIRQG